MKAGMDDLQLSEELSRGVKGAISMPFLSLGQDVHPVNRAKQQNTVGPVVVVYEKLFLGPSYSGDGLVLF